MASVRQALCCTRTQGLSEMGCRSLLPHVEGPRHEDGFLTHLDPGWTGLYLVPHKIGSVGSDSSTGISSTLTLEKTLHSESLCGIPTAASKSLICSRLSSTRSSSSMSDQRRDCVLDFAYTSGQQRLHQGDRGATCSRTGKVPAISCFAERR